MSGMHVQPPARAAASIALRESTRSGANVTTWAQAGRLRRRCRRSRRSGLLIGCSPARSLRWRAAIRSCAPTAAAATRTLASAARRQLGLQGSWLLAREIAGMADRTQPSPTVHPAVAYRAPPIPVRAVGQPPAIGAGALVVAVERWAWGTTVHAGAMGTARDPRARVAEGRRAGPPKQGRGAAAGRPESFDATPKMVLCDRGGLVDARAPEDGCMQRCRDQLALRGIELLLMRERPKRKTPMSQGQRPLPRARRLRLRGRGAAAGSSGARRRRPCGGAHGRCSRTRRPRPRRAPARSGRELRLGRVARCRLPRGLIVLPHFQPHSHRRLISP